MKTLFIIQAILLLTFPLYAQNNSSFGQVETVTKGECEDINPILTHGTMKYGYSQSFQWLLFVRNSGNGSEIIGKKFFLDDALWDSSEVSISSSHIPQSQKNPDVSEILYYQNLSEHTFRLAAWEQLEGSVWNIYFSSVLDSASAWKPSQPFTRDTVDNTNVQIRPLADSSFIVVWKRKSTLLYSLVNPVMISVPETVAVGTSETLEFDIISNYSNGGLVWTSRDTANKNIMISRSFDTYPTFALTAPETLFYYQSAFNPQFASCFYGNKSVFFETILNDNHEIMIWKEYYYQDPVENVSNDSLADDRNPQSFSLPQIVTKRGVAENTSAFSYYGILVMEKYVRTDSMLIFSMDYVLSDTVKSTGYNRNACIGSDMFWIGRNYSVLTVWESNRSGRSHIYSRLVELINVGVEPPILSPSSFELEQNYPNPFNPKTNFRFTIAHSELVSLRVFDLLGREVAVIVDEYMTPGVYLKQWNANSIANGIYFYRLTAGSFTDTKKLVLLK
jgi:hypothetical protein